MRQHSPIIDQYLVKSLYQKDDMTANELAEIKSGINNLSQQIINNKMNTATNNSTNNNSSNVPFAAGYLSQLDYHSSPMHQARFCPKCSTQSSAYLDMLKYELARRIEFQVARGLIKKQFIYEKYDFKYFTRILFCGFRNDRKLKLARHEVLNRPSPLHERAQHEHVQLRLALQHHVLV